MAARLLVHQALVAAFLVASVLADAEHANNSTWWARTEPSESALHEGRTFVHHAMKRLAVLVPVLTFKLGIMFTMLLVTALASTKGLLVGALLLALGMGHFIAGRFAVPAVAPAIAALPQPVTRVHVLPPAVAAPTAPWPAAHLHHHVDKVEPAVYAHPYTSWRAATR